MEKDKVCVYLTEEEKKMLNSLMIKQLNEGGKAQISPIFCKALKLLHKKTIGPK